MFANLCASLAASLGERTRGLLVGVALLLISSAAFAGGPRFITGSGYANPGVVMSWGNPAIQYYTDPADLNPNVTHAQADAVVAAAAAVWNVPTSSVVLSQGGSLSEHISSANAYFDGSSVVFPSDADAVTGTSKPIGVVYDTDGSVTDLLLGAGASDPSSCRQNEVTESVDGFSPSGTITHALIIINGRCAGPTSDQLNELQYKLMRIFGRVLGLGWSQLNDNVFTGSPTPTADQMANWPVMHPMDVVCGLYEYQCMVNPFVLRNDDLSGLAMLYPVTGTPLADKVLSSAGALKMYGYMGFPNTDKPASMINLTVTRVGYGQAPEGFQTASALSGFRQYQNNGNPVTGAEAPADNAGMWPNSQTSYWEITRIPLPAQYLTWISMEAVNPLYSGPYSLGPFQRPPVSLPGAIESQPIYKTAADAQTEVSFFRSDFSSTCDVATNGMPYAPNPADPTGVWNGVVCGGYTASWKSMSARAGRSWTIEITALDNAGGQTTGKLRPVVGVWNSTDSLGQLPTVAAQPVPLNSQSPGMTQLLVPAGSGDVTYYFVIADFYGWGRPDFKFKARVLYADAVSPANVSASGGQITITGMGFAQGNRVTVNGVVAKVLSWSSNQIVAVAPTAATAKAQGGIPVNVSVTDLMTGGSSTITGGLTYPGTGANGLVQMSAPASLETGVVGATPFAVQVVGADGVTPVPGANVKLAVTAGNATLSACGLAASCTVPANSAGVVQTKITGVSTGVATIAATEVTGGVSVQVTLQDVDPARAAAISTPTAYVAAGANVSVPLVLRAMQDGSAAAQVPVTWTTSNGLSVTGSSATDGGGASSILVGINGMAPGTASVQGCVWSTVCVNWPLVSVDASQWMPAVVRGAGQSVAASAHLSPVALQVTDPAGHPLIGAAVTVSQVATAWEGPCPAKGRCAAAPVLASNVSTSVTDATGQVSVAPLEVTGAAEVVHLAVSSGTSGFVSLTLTKTP